MPGESKLPPALQPTAPHSLVTPGGRVHVHLVVSDMKRSIDFYTKTLGFFYDHGVRDAAWLTHKHLLLTISPGEPVQTVSAYFGWCLVEFAELDAYYARLHRSGCRLSAPPDEHASRTYFFLYDPDDYPIVFSQQRFEYPEVFPEESQDSGTSKP
jgi:catechol 2,3-dioxygenase-like lactoylglutathione lyase family enzyme